MDFVQQIPLVLVMTHFHLDRNVLHVDRMMLVITVIIMVKATGRANILSLVKKKKVSRLASTNVKPVALAEPVRANPVAQELSKSLSIYYSPFVRGLCFTIGK